MTVSSRTPEGLPSHCVLCGAETRIEYSEPSGDAPCPNCGHLLWRSSQLFDQLQRSLSEALAIRCDEIRIESRLVEDLMADSLDVVELVMSMEDETGVTIPDADYEQIRTIGDVIRYLAER